MTVRLLSLPALLNSVQALWHGARPEFLNSVMDVGLVPGGMNQSRNTVHLSPVHPWSEDIRKTMRTRVSVFIAVDPKGLLKENGEEGELDDVFQSSTGSVLVRKLIPPTHFVSVQVTINGVWKEVWNRRALKMTAHKLTVAKEYVRACPPGTKYDLCDVEGSVRPGHIGQVICPACKMAIAKGSLLCFGCYSGFYYRPTSHSLSGHETPTAPSGVEDHGVHSSESEVVHGLEGPSQNGEKDNRKARKRRRGWKKNVFRYYRHAWKWYSDDGYRRREAAAKKTKLASRPMLSVPWTGRDRERHALDIALRPQDLLMMFMANILWVLNVPATVNIPDLRGLLHAFLLLLGGLDAVTVVCMMRQEKEADVIWAELTQEFLTLHNDIGTTKEFGKILSVTGESVDVFARAWRYTIAELDTYRSRAWEIATDQSPAPRNPLEIRADLDYQFQKRRAQDDGTERPTAKARGERYLPEPGSETATSSASGMPLGKGAAGVPNAPRRGAAGSAQGVSNPGQPPQGDRSRAKSRSRMARRKAAITSAFSKRRGQCDSRWRPVSRGRATSPERDVSDAGRSRSPLNREAEV